MVVNEKLTARIREALSGTSKVEEKNMFGGVAFMVNGKMCVTASDRGMMCRVDPDRMRELTAKKGCTIMSMKAREYPGYVRVSEDVLRSKKDLDYWLGVALEFNSRAKATPKKEPA